MGVSFGAKGWARGRRRTPTRGGSLRVHRSVDYAGVSDAAGFEIGNPEGFDASNLPVDHFMRIGDGDFRLALGSLGQDTIVAPALELADLELSLQKHGGRSNYGMILDNLERFDSADDAEKDDAGGSAKRFVIRRLDLRRIVVYVDYLPIGGELIEPAPVRIDGITLRDVGAGDEGGLAISELVGLVVVTVLRAVSESAIDLPGNIVGELGDGLEGLTSLTASGFELLGDVSRGIERGIDEAGGAIDEALDSVGDRIGGTPGTAVDGLGDGVEGAVGVGADVGGAVGDGLDAVGSGVEEAGRGVGDVLGKGRDLLTGGSSKGDGDDGKENKDKKEEDKDEDEDKDKDEGAKAGEGDAPEGSS